MSKEPWFNKVTVWLLRSPLHFFMSGKTLLTTVTGRKTGARYTVPTDYYQRGDTLTIVTRQDKTWWRNVRGGAPVTVWLRGQELPGLADADPVERAQAVKELRTLYPTMPDAQAEALAPVIQIVRITLGSAGEKSAADRERQTA
jgi:hypothetical protein